MAADGPLQDFFSHAGAYSRLVVAPKERCGLARRTKTMGERAGDIEWDYLDLDAAGALEPGALISAAAGGLPIYRIMSVTGGRAWLRDIRDGADRVTPLGDFHWRARGAES